MRNCSGSQGINRKKNKKEITFNNFWKKSNTVENKNYGGKA